MTKVIGTYDDRDMSLLAQDEYFRFVRWTPELSREEEDQLVQVVEWGKLERVKASPDGQVMRRLRRRSIASAGLSGLGDRDCYSDETSFSLDGLDGLDLRGQLRLTARYRRERCKQGPTFESLSLSRYPLCHQ